MSTPIDTAEVVNALAEKCHRLSRAKGWYDDTNMPLDATVIAAKLALIHSEVSEVLEAVRENKILGWTGEGGKPEGVPAELADVVIRVFDLCGALGIRIGDAILQKHAYNETRPYRHGGKAI